jgi:DNA-binding transcriptional LysR family regulator
MRGMAISDGRAVRARRSVALQNLDLNLLVSLDALLRERSVTRAAAGLGLSQPTLSTALSRLRRHFDDELLTRVGNSYELTPLATDLVERVTGAVGVLERVFAGQPEFDPAVSDREFTVVVSDYAATVLGGPLSELLAAEAPSVCLRFQQMRTETVDAAPESLRAVDGLLLPHGYLTDLPHQDLYEDQWVCMVGAGNEVVGDTFTLEHLHTLPMAVTYREPTRFTPAVKQLHMVGIEPRVVAVSESFLALPFLVAGTDRFALVQQRLAARLAAAADVRILPCPFPVTPLVEALWWHPVYERDTGHQWLRTVFGRVRDRLRHETV